MKYRAMIPKDPQERDFECWLALGKKGQGKSTIMRDVIDRWLKTMNEAWAGTPYKPKIFVHALSGSGAFKGIPNISEVAKYFDLDSPLDVLRDTDNVGMNKYWKMTNSFQYICDQEADIKEMHLALTKHFKCGLALFDEWTAYAKPNPSGWSTLVAFNHRNHFMDAFYACHGLMSVPKKMAERDVFSKIIVLKTGENYRPNDTVFDRFTCVDLIKKAFYIVKAAPKIPRVVQYHLIVDSVSETISEWNYMIGEYQPLGKKPIYEIKS